MTQLNRLVKENRKNRLAGVQGGMSSAKSGPSSVSDPHVESIVG